MAVVALVRASVASQPASVPVRIGLMGLRLPEAARDSDIAVGQPPGGSGIRARGLPPSLPGSLDDDHKTDGEQIVIDYSGDVVLEMDLPYRVELAAHDPAMDWPQHLRGF